MTERINAELAEMAALQDKHNREVHPDWRRQGFEYYRAVWIECAELLDHYGWKWWKHQQPDLEQVRLEIIDIWHFGLSELMRADAMAHVAERLARADSTAANDDPADRDQDFRAAVERLARASLDDRTFDVDAFVDVMRAVGMSTRALYEIYVGKNVLNSFRQAHGYKDGSYQKVWQGREDNAHLAEIVATLDPGVVHFGERLYAELERRYPGTSDL